MLIIFFSFSLCYELLQNSNFPVKTKRIVIVQNGVCPLAALIHSPMICVKGNRFLLTGFQLWGDGAESTPALSPSLPWDAGLFLLPKRLQAKTMPRSSPFPYLSLSCPRKQISILCTGGFRVAIFLQQLSQNMGCAALTLHVAVQDPCAMLHWITVSQTPEPSDAPVPAWDPASRSRLPTMQGLSPWWARHLLGPASASPCREQARA